ncbi:MAG: aldehyde dehydrogenase family protein, partial [Burkholderiaceae bacterium]
HVMRWAVGQLDALVATSDATGYGVTIGVHSRIDEHTTRVAARARVGNLYVNRTLIGATVGVQPFGGEGLSGTGPKAGGPFYLARLDEGRGAHRFTPSTDDLQWLPAVASQKRLRAALARCSEWDDAMRARLDAHCVRCEAAAIGMTTMRLPGPTGETNTLSLRPRETIACMANDTIDLVCQIIAAQAVGVVPLARRDALPPALQSFAKPWDEDIANTDDLQAVLVALPDRDVVRVRQACAARDGALVTVVRWGRNTEPVLQLWRLMREFAESVNTAAAGGNASLMTLNET